MTAELFQHARHEARLCGGPVQVLDAGDAYALSEDRLRMDWDDEGPVILAVVHPNGTVS